MNIKKIIVICLLIAIVAISIFAVTYNSNKNNDTDGKLNIIVTSFFSYDFVRQIVGDSANITFLLGPGVDAHSFEPSAKDLAKIQNSDLFVYVGESMEKWTEKVLPTLDLDNTKVIKLMDLVKLQVEEEIDGAEEEEDEEHENGSFEEHIWTSPANSMIIVEKLSLLISELDEENKEKYETNALSYIEEIKDVQSKIQVIVDNRVRDRLVFGDKMPMQYFLNEFGLTASAAFNGCSTETEPSVSTITYLTDKVREEQIPVVLYIELSSGKIAKTIAKEAGVEAIQIQSLHNVTKNDFKNSESYVSLMTRNLDVLRKVLQ